MRDFAKLGAACHAAGALLIVVVTEIVSLGLIKPPGEMGADIVVCEGQSIGNGLGLGGPYVGLFATRDKYVRQMPGRLVGETVDADGKRGFVLTLSTREQHIRREKATSNICTNAGLCALAFTVHLSLLGEAGFRRLAEINHAKASELADRIAAIPGVTLLNESFFNEFTVRLPQPAAPWRGSGGQAHPGRPAGVAADPERQVGRKPVAAGRDRDRDRTRHGAIDRRPEGGAVMVQSLDRSQGRAGGVAADVTPAPATFTGNRALQIEEPLIFEMGQAGRCGVDLPEPAKVKDRLNGLRRSGEIGLPGLSERQVVQHYTRLSQKNYAIDMGVYPLGSCTMKHNPRINEKVARLAGLGDLHPLQPVSTVQGALDLIDHLAYWLKTLTGMPAVAMSPAAGAHGETCGMMAIAAALDAKGERARRRVVLEPESRTARIGARRPPSALR